MKINIKHLKQLINKIELIRNEELGIVMSKNVYGSYVFSFFEEAYYWFNEDQMKIVKDTLWGIDGAVLFIEKRFESAEESGSKREMLDLLNAVYLLYICHEKIIFMVKDLHSLYCKTIFNPSILDIDIVTKQILLKTLSIEEFVQLLYVSKSRKVILTLATEHMKSSDAKEYDKYIFSEFNKKFKPFSFGNFMRN